MWARRTLHAFLLAYLGLAVPVAWAWGRDGHQIVGTIAQTQLHPAVREHLCTILPPFTAYESYYPKQGAPHKQYVYAPFSPHPLFGRTVETEGFFNTSCHLATLSAWPDTIHGWAPWSSTLHYINPTQDAPPSHCEYGEHGFVNERNVVTALYNYTSILADPPPNHNTTDFAATRDFALRMVTHLVGDMSQPLHLTGRARGGNDVWVQFEGRKARLHSVWDSQILLGQIRGLGNYTTPLRSSRIESALVGSTYDAYVRWILHEGLGQPALVGQPELPSWWSPKQQDQWISCPLPPTQASRTGTKQGGKQMVFSNDVQPKWTTGEAEDMICAYGWTWESHPLVCKYGFADPVPASIVAQQAFDTANGDMEPEWDDDETDDHFDDENEIDAERRRRRRRRRRPRGPGLPGQPTRPPSSPPLPELSGSYLDQINAYVLFIMIIDE